jgi:cytochrome P450
MDEYLYRIIRMRRESLGTTNDMLGHLIAMGMEDGLIRDQLLTMLIAGHDTSTALLSWTLYLLGRHPDIQRRVQAELDTMIGSHPPTTETVIELHFLEQVIEESLRLYPPIHLGSRVAADDLDFQGHTIPSGTRVMYSIYLTHRMKQYWHEPARFDPDRFSADRSRQRTPYTYLPFGGGPRNCIGAAFGRIEAKLVLARILQQFDLALLPNPVHAHMGATLEPRPGVLMQVVRRTAQWSR